MIGGEDNVTLWLQLDKLFALVSVLDPVGFKMHNQTAISVSRFPVIYTSFLLPNSLPHLYCVFTGHLWKSVS